jgi:D-beta-D-heptose 7-phosphate kinase/D-beta-D-heptose 1-phosphate adenosyltransferase
MEDKILIDFLKKNQKNLLKIHCVGDAIIDEYYKVKINRISPEHPIPVMVCQNDYVCKPGGSANVIYQLKHLNVDSTLICFNDNRANKVFSEHQINVLKNNFQFNASLPVKRRYMDNGVQVAPRHDFEKEFCGLNFQQIESFMQQISCQISSQTPEVVIFSDYNKGFFVENSLFKKYIFDNYKNSIKIVDPKSPNLEKWKGCNFFKPNAKEAQDLSGFKNWKDQCLYFKDKLECETVIITFGGEKVSGIWNEEFFEYVPNKKVNVESVIGAGDCFVAFFAVAIGHGFNPIESSMIAWNAGSVYVQQRMNRPVVPAELIFDKIVEPEFLAKRDFKLVFTNGCFDILHKGHLETLKFAKSKGEKLVVALNSDESIKRIKGPKRPIVSLEDRMALIAGFEFVDFVVSFNEETPLEVIKKIMPDVLVKGSDYNETNIVGYDIVPHVFVSPIIPNLSSSKIIEKYTNE